MRLGSTWISLGAIGLLACTAGKPGDDTDNPDDTDVVDTDVLDTDVVDTDVVDTDAPDTDVVDTDTKDTDVVDTATLDTDPGDTDGPPLLVPDITSQGFWVNCMPAIPRDPLGGSFDVHYQNDGALSAHATVVSATLTLTQAPLAVGTWTFAVTPAGSGVVGAGQQVDVTHDKVARSGSGTASGLCSYCNGTWTLDVSWLIDGVTVSDTLDAGSVSCVY